jgi:acyl-CoA synthetase (AMP-forming)/AMP-acid ligase II
MNIVELLRDQARQRPTAAALVDTCRGRDRVTTFAELERRSAQAARLLWDHGLRPGDAALIFYPMSAELYVALLALLRLGLAAMFLDPGTGRDHIERCCALQRPRALIAGVKAYLLCLLSPALCRVPVKFVIGGPLPGLRRWAVHERLEPYPDVLTCGPQTPALLTFTSGSTGQPKGALRSHGFLQVQHQAFAKCLDLRAGEIDLTTLPIVLLANLASGLTSVIPNADLRYPGAVCPGPILDQVERHGVTRSVASPAFFERLAQVAATGRPCPRLERLFAGGAAVFPRNLEQMQQLAPHAEVVAVYGSTEAEPIAHIGRRELSSGDVAAMQSGKGLLAGPPVPDIELRILRDQWGTPLGRLGPAQFAALTRGPDQPGEIVVTGAHVLKGYLQGRGEDETKFRVDGVTWHRTGDAGYVDMAGRLWLLGRCAARLHDARGELYPFAVEAVVTQDPRIRRAALVAHRGRRVLAVEFAGPVGPAPEELRRQLAWANIDVVQVLHRIPVDRRHNSKIDYPALRRLLGRTSDPPQIFSYFSRFPLRSPPIL